MQEDIANAMGLTGQIVMGQAIMVKSSEVRFVLIFCVALLADLTQIWSWRHDDTGF